MYTFIKPKLGILIPTIKNTGEIYTKVVDTSSLTYFYKYFIVAV